MKFAKAGLAAFAIIWFAAMAAALFWNFAPKDNFLGVTTSASSAVGGHSAGSIGKTRHLALVEATRRYRKNAENVSPGIANGSELAPVAFLNRELQRQGVNWRVRRTHGVTADIYEIS